MKSFGPKQPLLVLKVLIILQTTLALALWIPIVTQADLTPYEFGGVSGIPLLILISSALLWRAVQTSSRKLFWGAMVLLGLLILSFLSQTGLPPLLPTITFIFALSKKVRTSFPPKPTTE
jgi:hypothetical protein